MASPTRKCLQVPVFKRGRDVVCLLVRSLSTHLRVALLKTTERETTQVDDTKNLRTLGRSSARDIRYPCRHARDESRASMNIRIEVAHEGAPSGAAPRGQQ